MSLMGSVVTLYVLCWLLDASSSYSVNRNLNDTAPICAECSNKSTGLNSSENGHINVTHLSLLNTTGLNQQHLNKSQNFMLNQTSNDGKPSLNNTINDSTPQFNISFTQKPSTQDLSPPAKADDLTSGPEVTTAPLSHTRKNDFKDTTAGGRVSATATQAIKPVNATGTTLMTASATSITTTTATATSSTTTTTTPPPSATSPLSTAQMTSPHASITVAPPPNIVSSTTVSTTHKSTGLKPSEPETTTTTTTTTIAATGTTTTTTSSTTATLTASVSSNSSSTAQYWSPVVEVTGQDLTRQLIDKASLLALLLFGLLFFFVVVAVFLTQAYESYRRKDYTQVDYLINGMYTDSGV